MNVERDAKKAEAIKRLKQLGIINDAIKQYKEDDVVMYSEPPLGALFWLDEEQQRLVKEFEEKHGALVYIAVRSYADFGKMDSYLYVSDYQDEWEWERDELSAGYPMTYTYNYDDPEFSEFGCIGIERRNGGLIRNA